MFRIFATLIILAISVFSINAQSFRLIGGIGAAYSYGNYKGLNFVLDRYNETRQGQQGAAQITRSMGGINTNIGLNWQLGFLYETSSDIVFYMGINRVGRSAETFARATDVNGNVGQRDVEFSANSVNFEFGLGRSNGLGYFMLGSSLDFIKTKASTRVNGNDFVEVIDDGNIGASVFFDANFFITPRFSIGLRPFAQLPFLNTGFADLNRAINSATAFRDSYEDSESSTANVGVQIMVRILTID